MLHSFPQQQTRHMKIAIIALFCLCWHLLLPTMMNLGWAPTVYGMSEHCHMLAGQTMEMPQAEMHQQHKVKMLTQKQEPPDSTEKLAEKIMKSCPLCSHGLSGGLLVLFSGICLFVILALAKNLSAYIASTYQIQFYWCVDYYIPPPQAPPIP